MQKSGLALRLLLCLLCTACVTKKDKTDSDKPVDYKISGLSQDEGTEEFLEAVLQTNAEADINKALQSRGYYAAQTTQEGDQVTIEPGPLTVITQIKIDPPTRETLFETIDIKVGDALNADKVLATQLALFEKLEQDSCALKIDVSHGVVLDTEKHTAELTYYIEEGEQTKFGSVVFTGQKTVKEDYITERADWKEGECYKRSTLRESRQNILGTGLFSSVDVVIANEPNEEGLVPVEFKLTEAKHRTLRAGVSFYTDEGPGATFGWQHRNFLGQGERFDVELTASTLEQALEVSLTKPHYYRDDQTLSINGFINRQDTDAFSSLGIGGGVNINRKINEHFTANVGADLELTQIEEEGSEEEETFFILSPHASLTYDSRDDKLDATKGWLLSTTVEPSIDVLGQSDPYFKTTATAQNYQKINDRLVFASRLHIGSIIGASTDSLPASERFFAGGGGSVRGFGFQDVGPVDDDGDPEGGRSLVEGALDLRYKINDTVGLVTFLDFGQVDNTVAPNFNDLSFGAGVGARYYTDFGPLRVDVGVPLNNRENTASVQFYISIGQAF